MFMLIGLKRGCFFSKFETDNGDLILNKLSIDLLFINSTCAKIIIEGEYKDFYFFMDIF